MKNTDQRNQQNVLFSQVRSGRGSQKAFYKSPREKIARDTEYLGVKTGLLRSPGPILKQPEQDQEWLHAYPTAVAAAAPR